MSIKIDREKAYDRLKWIFVKDTLEDIGFPDNIVSLIWHYGTSSRMWLLWNGKDLEDFSPSRGIWQGDPISPYLFVLCLERLFHLINQTVSTNSWRPVQISRRGPKISHLAFTGDLILFVEANIEQALVIKRILDTFCISSGQKMSQDKTKIFFSKNTN